MPVFFFHNQLDLIQKIRKFDEIIRNYPIEFVTFYLISMQDIHGSSVRPPNRESRGYNIFNQEGNPIQSLIYEQVIIQILFHNDFDSLFVSFPFVPFIHPNWFIQKNIKLFNQSKKILFTPLLFGCPPQTFEKKLTKLVGLNSTFNKSILIRNYLDDNEPKDYAKAIDRYTKSVNTGDFKKFSLNVRKNDIFDILDSV